MIYFYDDWTRMPTLTVPELCDADSSHSTEEEEGLLFKKASPRDLEVHIVPDGQWRPLHRVLLHPQVSR